MMRLIVTLLLLVVPSLAWGQPNLTIPNVFGGRSTGTILQFDQNWQATADYINQKTSRVVNIRGSAGVVCDGTNDDTLGIQAALTSAGAGATVFVPPGTCRTSAVLSLPTNVSIVGVPEVSILKPTTPNQTVIALVTNSIRSQVTDLVIDGSAATGIIGISIVQSEHIDIRRVVFKGVTKTVFADRANVVRYDSLRSESLIGGRSYGYLEITDTTNAAHAFTHWITDYHVRTLGAYSGTPPAQAILLHRAVNVLIRGFAGDNLSSAVGNGNGIVMEDDCQGVLVEHSYMVQIDRGVRLQAVAGRAPYLVTLNGVAIDQPRTAGVDYVAGSNLMLTGCSVTNASASAIGIYLAADIANVVNCVVQGGGANGILIESNHTNITIAGSRVSDTGTAIGIAPGTSTNVIITDNDVSLNNTTKLNISGASGVVVAHGNLGADASFVFTDIGTALQVNGEFGHCRDCKVTTGTPGNPSTYTNNTCTSGGNGALAVRLNGTNVCYQ